MTYIKVVTIATYLAHEHICVIKVSSVQLRCLARRILNLYADFLSFAGDVNGFMIAFYTGDDTQEAELKQCRSRSSHGTSIQGHQDTDTW